MKNIEQWIWWDLYLTHVIIGSRWTFDISHYRRSYHIKPHSDLLSSTTVIANMPPLPHSRPEAVYKVCPPNNILKLPLIVPSALKSL